MSRTTNISIEADRKYVRTVSAFAKKNDVLMATIVRCAMDKACGPNLENLASFFAEHCASLHNSENVSTTESEQ